MRIYDSMVLCSDLDLEKEGFGSGERRKKEGSREKRRKNKEQNLEEQGAKTRITRGFLFLPQLCHLLVLKS